MRRLQNEKRSIGEVLALLKQEFDDLTISKIRFLEGQGLVTPERTESGYRKFSEEDIGRLRYVLRQQKEHFLPLKVIKGRMERVNEDSPATDVGENPGATTNGNSTFVSGGPEALGRRDLLAATGLSESQLRELESFGLIVGRNSSEGVWYDERASMVAKLAARILSHGAEVRHLRIFKSSAEREADLYRQLTVQVRGARNTQAKMEAQARLDELLDLGASMRAELIRAAVQP